MIGNLDPSQFYVAIEISASDRIVVGYRRGQFEVVRDGAMKLTAQCLVLFHCQPCLTRINWSKNIPFHTERESRTLVGNILAMGFGLSSSLAPATVDKFVVLLLQRPRGRYGKVQGCAALIDRRVSRDLGIAEGTTK